MKGVILAVFDGLGIAGPGPGNAYFLADPQYFKEVEQLYPHTQLEASGEAVGLPSDEVGSSEVGHINIGAGKIVYQSLPRINLSIADGSFFNNSAFIDAISHVKDKQSNLHMIGLIGGGTVHACTAHLYALLFLCKEKGVKNIFLHIITDGRDSPPQAAVSYIEEVQAKLDQIGVGKIASILGRYYAMDRDRRWDRVEKAYTCLTHGESNKASSWREAIDQSYKAGKTDEFIEPTNIIENGSPVSLVSDNDAVIFFNFRIDRPRELTKAFVLDNFERDANIQSFDPYDTQYNKKITDNEEGLTPPFQRGSKINNLFFVMMTEYDKDLPAACAYPPNIVQMPLGRILSEHGIHQLRLSESEKERFVTYYFNGLRSSPLALEDNIIIPSPKVDTYDQKSEMSAYELTDKLIENIQTGKYRFILINYANPDMVGHTGNIQAGVQAMKHLDTLLEKIVKASLQYDYTLLITADHGNIDEMIDPKTGNISTEHSGNPVPFYAISNEFKGKNAVLQSGILADIAPTILSLLEITKPFEMTGRNLLDSILRYSDDVS